MGASWWRQRGRARSASSSADLIRVSRFASVGTFAAASATAASTSESTPVHSGRGSGRRTDRATMPHAHTPCDSRAPCHAYARSLTTHVAHDRDPVPTAARPARTSRRTHRRHARPAGRPRSACATSGPGLAIDSTACSHIRPGLAIVGIAAAPAVVHDNAAQSGPRAGSAAVPGPKRSAGPAAAPQRATSSGRCERRSASWRYTWSTHPLPMVRTYAGAMALLIPLTSRIEYRLPQERTARPHCPAVPLCPKGRTVHPSNPHRHCCIADRGKRCDGHSRNAIAAELPVMRPS